MVIIFWVNLQWKTPIVMVIHSYLVSIRLETELVWDASQTAAWTVLVRTLHYHHDYYYHHICHHHNCHHHHHIRHHHEHQEHHCHHPQWWFSGCAAGEEQMCETGMTGTYDAKVVDNIFILSILNVIIKTLIDKCCHLTKQKLCLKFYALH